MEMKKFGQMSLSNFNETMLRTFSRHCLWSADDAVSQVTVCPFDGAIRSFHATK